MKSVKTIMAQQYPLTLPDGRKYVMEGNRVQPQLWINLCYRFDFKARLVTAFFNGKRIFSDPLVPKPDDTKIVKAEIIGITIGPQMKKPAHKSIGKFSDLNIFSSKLEDEDTLNILSKYW